MKRVKFRNLPIYQESIRELISSNDRKVKVKTKSNVLREFEQNKWGCIYNNLRDDDNNTYRLNDIENLYFGLEKKQTFVEHGNFFYTKQNQLAFKEYWPYKSKMFRLSKSPSKSCLKLAIYWVAKLKPILKNNMNDL